MVVREWVTTPPASRPPSLRAGEAGVSYPVVWGRAMYRVQGRLTRGPDDMGLGFDMEIQVFVES